MTKPSWSAITLAVFDVDGTIIANHGPPVVGRATIDSFQAAREAGIAVTLATGRTLDYVRAHLTEPLGLTTPVITAQGAVIGDPVTGEIFRRTTIARPAARQVLDHLDRDERLTVLYVLSDTGTTRMMERGGSPDASHDDLFGVPRTRVAALSPAFDATIGNALKIVVEAPLDGERDVVGEFAAALGGALQVARTHPRLVEITAPGVDKGSGLAGLTDYLGLDLAQVLAVGDNDNDIPMLRAAGVAVALGDGSPRARAASDWIAPSFDEGGAAAALERAIRMSAAG
jgi:Cof subfamily protein (haloacid dehalogenase superfamily)